MGSSEGMTAASCRVCGKPLTIDEFRACSGFGHLCAAHLPAGTGSSAGASPRPRSAAPRLSGGGGVRERSAFGSADYPCRAQFARDGRIRRGRLTSNHPSSIDGGVVFVSEGIGYGPTEIVTLFIRHAAGRDMAVRAGFRCHD